MRLLQSRSSARGGSASSADERISTTEDNPPSTRLSVRQAAFIGVGGTVGAGIFSLLGPAGEVAGSAVWLSFALAGGVVLLQGYSFAKLGARYPSAAGLLEYVARGWGGGHITGVIAWLLFATNAIVTSMVAVTFGSYASSAVADGDAIWTRLFAVAVIVVMTLVNISGTRAVARVETVVVGVVIGILALFAVVTLANMEPHLLAFSGYPPIKDIVAGVGLTLFAFLGFAVVTFTAKDLAEPERQLPRAVFLALGIATVIYMAVALGVFGTLTVDEVTASDSTALAVAARPALGRVGYWLMTVTALFASAGATNAGLYPVSGLSEHMASTGQFPPALGRRYLGRVAGGLLLTALVALILAVGFDLTAIVSMGSAIALAVWAVIGVGHLRIRAETRAHTALLVAAVATATTMLVAFALTTLVSEPAAVAAIVGIVAATIALDFTWKRARARSSLEAIRPANATGPDPRRVETGKGMARYRRTASGHGEQNDANKEAVMGSIRVVRGSDIPASPSGLSTEHWSRRVVEVDELLTINEARNEPHAISRWHHHSDHTGLVYVLKGKLRLEWGPDGRDTVDLAAGDFYVIDPNTIHRESNPGPEDQVLIAFVVGEGPFAVEVDAPEPTSLV